MPKGLKSVDHTFGLECVWKVKTNRERHQMRSKRRVWTIRNDSNSAMSLLCLGGAPSASPTLKAGIVQNSSSPPPPPPPPYVRLLTIRLSFFEKEDMLSHRWKYSWTEQTETFFMSLHKNVCRRLENLVPLRVRQILCTLVVCVRCEVSECSLVLYSSTKCPRLRLSKSESSHFFFPLTFMHLSKLWFLRFNQCVFRLFCRYQSWQKQNCVFQNFSKLLA